jgi:cytochrome b561
MFGKPRSVVLRLWHWLDALVIFGLLLTVLLRDTMLSARVVGALVKDKLDAAGAAVSNDQARGVARALTERLWAWHVYLGYGLCALALLRIVARVLEAVQGKASAPGAGAPAASASLHHRLVRLLHGGFYVALALMVVTGIMLSFKDALGLPRSASQLAHGLHENVMWFVIGFIVLHIGGVLRTEHGEEPGIVSTMIHGRAPRS